MKTKATISHVLALIILCLLSFSGQARASTQKGQSSSDRQSVPKISLAELKVKLNKKSSQRTQIIKGIHSSRQISEKATLSKGWTYQTIQTQDDFHDYQYSADIDSKGDVHIVYASSAVPNIHYYHVTPLGTTHEIISTEYSPGAVFSFMDQNDIFHVAFSTSETHINYMTNTGGMWARKDMRFITEENSAPVLPLGFLGNMKSRNGTPTFMILGLNADLSFAPHFCYGIADNLPCLNFPLYQYESEFDYSFRTPTDPWVATFSYGEGTLLTSETTEFRYGHRVSSSPKNWGTVFLGIDRGVMPSYDPDFPIFEVYNETSIEANVKGDLHMAYSDIIRDKLKYVSVNQEGELLEVVDENPGLARGIKLKLKHDRTPHIAYTNGSSEIIQYVTEINGNWIKQTVDITEGMDQPSLFLAANQSNQPTLIYRVGDKPVIKIARHSGEFETGNIAAAASVASAVAFPNPLRPSKFPGTEMTFANLPNDSKIKIYTTTGELVRDLVATPAGDSSWNGKNNSGEDVASGVYLAFIEGSGGNKTVKVAVQR